MYYGICSECGEHLVGRCTRSGCPNNGAEAAAEEIARLEAEFTRLQNKNAEERGTFRLTAASLVAEVELRKMLEAEVARLRKMRTQAQDILGHTVPRNLSPELAEAWAAAIKLLEG